jgi:hypothetical protein
VSGKREPDAAEPADVEAAARGVSGTVQTDLQRRFHGASSVPGQKAFRESFARADLKKKFENDLAYLCLKRTNCGTRRLVTWLGCAASLSKHFCQSLRRRVYSMIFFSAYDTFL